MVQASLVEIFRYAASGVIALFYLRITNDRVAAQVMSLGEATVAIGALAFGALMYIFHRGVIFRWYTTRFRDSHPPTYRTWLRHEYTLTPNQAVLVYALVRPKLPYSTERATHFANVHYGLTAGLLTIPFFLASLFSGRWFFGLPLLVFGVALLVATRRFHGRGEDEELIELMRFSEDEPDTIKRVVSLVLKSGVN